MSDVAPAPAGTRYLARAVAAAGLGLVGYVGYVVYPRFDLSAGAGAGLLVEGFG